LVISSGVKVPPVALMKASQPVFLALSTAQSGGASCQPSAIRYQRTTASSRLSAIGLQQSADDRFIFVPIAHCRRLTRVSRAGFLSIMKAQYNRDSRGAAFLDFTMGGD
jgi:hypothetical protein